MRKNSRSGIAMIELIFSIAVMGIVMMSVPMLIQQSTKSTYTALQQESVAILASHIQTIMGLEWDNENNASNHYSVLGTGSGTIASCSADYPPGTSDAEGRYCRYESNASFLNASAIGTDSDDIYGYDDVDDYDGNVTTLTLYADESIDTCEGNYVDLNVEIVSEVKYLDDTPRNASGAAGSLGPTTTYSNVFDHLSSSTSNIKAVSVVLSSSNAAAEIANKQIRLSAFMCNIGAPRQYYMKEY